MKRAGVVGFVNVYRVLVDVARERNATSGLSSPFRKAPSAAEQVVDLYGLAFGLTTQIQPATQALLLHALL